MTLKEYIESNGYKVEDLTEKELALVEDELNAIENGIEITDGFFSPMSEFSQRKIQEGLI